MFCPKCGDEFREGFERCTKCNVDLVETLAAKMEDKDNEDNLKFKFMDFKVEEWLKMGGIVFIILGVLHVILTTVSNFVLHDRMASNNQSMIVIILSVLFSILNKTMSGLVYYGVGELISLLKMMVNYENE
ncbi:zinc ribbon domain-containing protein [Orenia marismortui]|uniref:zinc ribbon domain-containing protein n=1 Tax=Orenia marismortui TaxID=46469 RepID=UPI00037B3DFE|nr:zinc ribbon domain-containing protein [Orenia marismortui]